MRNSKPVWDPGSYCPICGSKFGPRREEVSAHRCPPATLAAIDGANTAALRGHVPFANRPICERLAAGLDMLEEWSVS